MATLADDSCPMPPDGGIVIKRFRRGREQWIYILGKNYIRWSCAKRFRSIRRVQINRDRNHSEWVDLGGEA